jgi:hypothetical protein
MEHTTLGMPLNIIQCHILKILRNFMEQNLAQKANRCSATKEIPRLLRKPSLQDPVIDSYPSQINPIHGDVIAQMNKVKMRLSQEDGGPK